MSVRNVLAAMTHLSRVLNLDVKQSFVTPKSYIYIYICLCVYVNVYVYIYSMLMCMYLYIPGDVVNKRYD